MQICKIFMLLHERTAGGSIVADFSPVLRGSVCQVRYKETVNDTKDERLTLFCLSPSGALFTCRQGGRQAFLHLWKAEGNAEWKMSRARLVNNNNGSFGQTVSIGGFRWLTSESDSMLRRKTGSAGNSQAGLAMVYLMD